MVERRTAKKKGKNLLEYSSFKYFTFLKWTQRKKHLLTTDKIFVFEATKKAPQKGITVFAVLFAGRPTESTKCSIKKK